MPINSLVNVHGSRDRASITRTRLTVRYRAEDDQIGTLACVGGSEEIYARSLGTSDRTSLDLFALPVLRRAN